VLDVKKYRGKEDYGSVRVLYDGRFKHNHVKTADKMKTKSEKLQKKVLK
jgi:hypothetical protein